MAQKKTKKKVARKKKKRVSQITGTTVSHSENRQVLLVLLALVILFGSFLGIYFYVQGLKTFEYDSISWTVEKQARDFIIYHGQFQTLNFQMNNIHNLFLRADPRKNEVPVQGAFSQFRLGGVISFDETVFDCRGNIGRGLVVFRDFLENGIGMSVVETATHSAALSENRNVSFVDCTTFENITVIQIRMGDESMISHSEEYPDCYEIVINSCDDTLGLEKFMVAAVGDYREAFG